MPELTFSLHEAQLNVHRSKARYKVVAAGRQSGKTTYARLAAALEVLAEHSWGGIDLTSEHEVGYIYPTFEQGKKVVWPRLKEIGLQMGAVPYENTGLLVFPNGRRMRLLGADNPDSLRGFTWSYVILDEFKDMDPDLFDEIIVPALGVCRGGALFIGTPKKGRPHFRKLWKFAASGDDPEWEAFSFKSTDSPFFDPNTPLKAALRGVSSDIIAQEYDATFLDESGVTFGAKDFTISTTEPSDGEFHIAVDLAGFSTEGRGKEKARRDEHAIAIVKAHKKGWWVKEIVHGHWDPREAALRIFQAARSTGTSRVGIEKGALANAVKPYLEDLMRQYSRWLNLIPLTHGNQRKEDRIEWALKGRCERQMITLNKGDWNSKLIEQACDFPNGTHDDLLDALAYIDQMATTTYADEMDYEDKYIPGDSLVGY